MRRITGQDHPPGDIAIGQQQLRLPDTAHQDFVDGNFFTQRSGDDLLRIQIGGIELGREVALYGPGVDFVLGNDGGRRGEKDVPELAMPMQGREIA